MMTRPEFVHTQTALRTTIPIHRGADERWYSVLSSPPLGDLRVGELVEAVASFEVTNNLANGKQFSVVGRLIIATGQEITPSDPQIDAQGIEQWRWLLCGGGGRNLSNSALVHHDPIERAGWLDLDRYYGERRVNFVVKCVTSDDATAGQVAHYEGTDCVLAVKRWKVAA